MSVRDTPGEERGRRDGSRGQSDVSAGQRAAARGLGERQGGPSLRVSEGLLGLAFWPPEPWENPFLLFESPGL